MIVDSVYSRSHPMNGIQEIAFSRSDHVPVTCIGPIGDTVQEITNIEPTILPLSNQHPQVGNEGLSEFIMKSIHYHTAIHLILSRFIYVKISSQNIFHIMKMH
jgi:hypothetical protein